MKTASIIFPHQLFQASPIFKKESEIFLVEEYLFFKQFPFHKQKIAFHRASMKKYHTFVKKELGLAVNYIDAQQDIADVRLLIPYLAKLGYSKIQFIDPVDDWLQRRMLQCIRKTGLTFQSYTSPSFLNSKEELASFFRMDKKKYHQTNFYKEERKKRNILIEADQTPVGGKWTFDMENRKKYPVKKVPPSIQFPDVDQEYKEAVEYTNRHFSDHLGSVGQNALYPTDFASTKSWFNQFLKDRFLDFGAYEDAIVSGNAILHHSVLTPMLNVGLITPKEVLNQCLLFAEENNIPINSTEGFVRQIMGWREFIRGIYITRGREERTMNFWQFDRKIPSSFYDGTTGILPLDNTIKEVLKTGYCHHIERLMILGNFMMLCEFDPDEVYRWFMEMFIDAYDWVIILVEATTS